MECEDIFAKDNSDLGKTDLLEHEIDTSNCKPMKQHPHWVPPYQQEVINSWKCFKLQARLSNLNILRAVQWYLLRNMTEHTVCALTTVKLTSWQRRMSYIPATLDRWRVRHLGWGSVFFFASIWPPGTGRCKWKKRMGLHCKTAFSTHQGHLWPPPD